MSKIKDFSNNIKKQALKKVLYSAGNADSKNLAKLLSTLEMVVPGVYKERVRNTKKAVKEDNGFIRFLRRMLSKTDLNCREKFVMNFIGNGFFVSEDKRQVYIKQGKYVPTTILISPSMRCNLKCVGCYAYKYSKKDDMSYKTFDRVVGEAKDMGVSFFTILGGEPLIYPHLFKIFKKHNDSYFQFFTNGTMLSENKVKELKKLGNAVPMISIEGDKKLTDERRGKGTYKKIMKAAKLLKKHKIPFGVSVAVTTKNVKMISSVKYMKSLIDMGAYFCWWFLYMPIGAKPDLSLMPDAKQRKILYEQAKKIREKLPIFLVDFWNDAPSVGGCIAGKYYCHITPKGDVEPCIFTHFAADNVNDKHLADCMDSDYFKALRKQQPYNDNLYMPCMWIDNPQVSREVHKKYGVYPTHVDAEDILEDEITKKHIDKYAKEVKEVYTEIWEKEKVNFCSNCPNSNNCNK